MNWLLQMLLPVTAGFFLDLLIGDPVWLYHPVRLIGHLITGTEKIIRNCFPKTERGEKAGGVLLVLIVVSVSMLIPGLLLVAAYRYAWQAGLILESFLCGQLLAVKSLRTESDKVYRALTGGSLEEGRRAVSMIVGRDTDSLTEEGVIKATVETVAENTSDGVIAPLFYMIFGGAVLGFVYKAVNTMDSMVGYKNEKYQNFGMAAARLDDIVNYIPARLSAWIMIGAARAGGFDAKEATRIYRRDRHNSKSPNAAQTESVMAGALGIQLAGDTRYFGKLHKKPFIGDKKRAVETEDIRRSHRLLYLTAIGSLVLFTALKIVVLCIVCL